MVDPPAEVADIAEFTTVIIGIVERFSTAAENLQALGTAIRTAVEEILPSWETLPDLPIAGLTKAIVERVEQVLRVSRVIRAVDCTEILDHVAAAGASYESKPDAKLRKSAVMSRLRPVNSIRGYTFQGIKGLEFEGVALLFCSSPYLPYKYEKDLWGSLQLFYVGITRVKRHLVLHMPSPSKFAPIVAARIASRDVIGSDPPLWMQE
jgi:superfamily I DNA/RNA helicase